MKYFPRNNVLKYSFQVSVLCLGISFSENSLLLLPTYYLYTNICTFYFVHLKNMLVSFVFKKNIYNIEKSCLKCSGCSCKTSVQFNPDYSVTTRHFSPNYQ